MASIVLDLNAGALRHTHKLRKAAHTHLLHHAAAMNLDGLFNRAEIVGDLLVETSSNHMPKHLALPRRECCKPCGEGYHLGARLTLTALLFSGMINGRQECVGI